MKNNSLSHLSLGVSLLVGAALTGCAGRTPRIYEWGSYQEQVYEYYKSQDTSPNKQIAALEASSSGEVVGETMASAVVVEPSLSLVSKPTSDSTPMTASLIVAESSEEPLTETTSLALSLAR